MGIGNFRLSREGGGGADKINFVNLIWRVLQFVIGLIVLIMYATQPTSKEWAIFNNPAFKWGLGIAAGALAVATTPFLALIPFFLGYRIVAFACVWDFIVMAVYAGTFAYFKSNFPYGEDGDVYKAFYIKYGVSGSRVDVMRAAVTIDVVGMVLWLCTFLMAVIVLGYGMVRGRGPTK